MLLLGVAICKLGGRGVVNLDGRGWLRMAHFGDRHADGDGFLGVDVGGADFGLSLRAHDIAHDFVNRGPFRAGAVVRAVSG